MNRFNVIAFTHKQLDLIDIGKLHLTDDVFSQQLHQLKQHFQLEELMYLSTCNRVEFLLVHREGHEQVSPSELLMVFAPQLNSTTLTHLSYNAVQYEEEHAVKHLFKVAASIDSLVLGEREIITQVRNAYDKCLRSGLTGDMLRIIVQQTIQCAKQVYTETNIARNPVSVVSLAYHQLKEFGIHKDARVIIVGSGVTNTNMAKFLQKHGIKNITVFNRTLENAEKLATEIGADAFALTALKGHKKGFDILLTCTGATEQVITEEIYSSLLNGDASKKAVIDLAVPNDFDTAICNTHAVNLIEVKSLQTLAQQNIAKREKELVFCKKIIAKNLKEFQLVYKTRQVELAMSDVPKKVKEIRETAVNSVFAKDIETLDTNSKEILDKVIAYLEKKYISVPMVMAKEILLDELENE